MKTKVYLGIVIRIIILFSIGMMASYIPDHLRDFFGDVKRNIKSDPQIDGWYDWGVRHHWYFWMCVSLFMASLANVIVGIVKLIKRNYDTSNWNW